MERARRLAAFWNWLPAFRAVAELEHLPSAAEEFRVSASALSRSVRQLEDHLGVQLFERQGGRITLNEEGRELLVVVRRAMRMVDDGADALKRETLTGSLRIVAPGPFAALYVLPALTELRMGHPNLVPQLLSMNTAQAGVSLLAGKIDIALLDDPLPEKELSIEKLTQISYGIYCGEGHPLFEVVEPTRNEVLAHPFVTPPEGQDDHWAPDVPRIVGMRLSQLQLGLDVCGAGQFLAVLPDPIAEAHSVRLRRLPFDELPPAALYACYREHLGVRNKVSYALDALRKTVHRGE